MNRAAASSWPHVFLPALGCRPLAVEPRRNERVLHVCLRVPGDPQTALANALRGLTTDGGAYAEVDWYALRGIGANVGEAMLAAAQSIRPGLTFMQIQTDNVISDVDVHNLRAVCEPGAVIVQWDGDRRFPPGHPERSWFPPLGKACDASLVTCTTDAAAWAALGVPGAGYLQIGVDTDLWKPTTPDPAAPDIALLAGYYAHLGYQTRLEAAQMLSARYPGRFGVYGGGWNGHPEVAFRPFVPHEAEAPIYSKAQVAISISIRNDLARYTSDRLLRCLAAGAVTLVEYFPDCDGLGLREGVNCFLWNGMDELRHAVNTVLFHPDDSRWPAMRQAARELALTHSWDARMSELAAIVEAIRAERK